MATTPVEFFAPPGLTLDLELYPYGSDTIANGAGGDAATEHTNRDGLYSANVTETISGWHSAHVYDGSNNLIAVGAVYMEDDTSIKRVHDAADRIYPVEDGSIPTAHSDAAGGLPISDAGGLDLDAKIGALTFTVANKVDANATHISGDATAADNAESFFDGTGYAGTNNVIPTVTTLTGHTPQTGDSFARIGAAGAGLTDLGGMSTTMKGQVQTEAEEALQSHHVVLVKTTIATLASQTSFTLTAGSADNDAYNGCEIVIEDAVTAAQKAVGVVLDYTGATKTITLKDDPAVFTMATTDIVTIRPSRSLKPTVDNRVVDIDASGFVERVVLVDTTTTNTDMRGTNSAALASVCTEARLAELDAANLPADVDQIKADLPQRITKNVALSAFPFFMVLTSDHITGATGKTVTATRSLDGAAFAACANAVSEIANGWYKIDLAAADLNANTVALKFTATDCDARNITIVTQPT